MTNQTPRLTRRDTIKYGGAVVGGGLLAGCENYPECDTGYAMPSGLVVGVCACGLPIFETSGGRRCLDSGCEGTGQGQADDDDPQGI